MVSVIVNIIITDFDIATVTVTVTHYPYLCVTLNCGFKRHVHVVQLPCDELKEAAGARGAGELLGLLNILLFRHSMLLPLRPVIGHCGAGREGHSADEGDVAGGGVAGAQLEPPACLPDGLVRLGGLVAHGEGGGDRLVAPVVALVRGHNTGVCDHFPVTLAPPGKGLRRSEANLFTSL